MITEEQIHESYKSGVINEYFYNQLLKKINILPDDLQDTYYEETKNMSALGVNSIEEQKTFFYILLHTPDILEETVESAQSSEIIAKIAALVYKNLNKYPVDTLLNFFTAVAKAAKELNLPIKNVVRQKIAYPTGYIGGYNQVPYDMDRWIKATRDIYARAQFNSDLSEAMDFVTKGWSVMEKLDYKAWLRFYQEGTQLKYKAAQKYYVSEQNNGYMIPNPIDFNDLRARIPKPIGPSTPEGFDVAYKPKEDINEARDKIEGQRAKIISRLNAAEKLLCSLDGQFFAGDDQDNMLKLLQELKRKVQTANKISIKSSLFVDFIYRTANMLNDSGQKRGYGFFYKIAQEAEKDLLLPDAPKPPGDEEELPDMSDMPMPSFDEDAGAREETLKALKDFFERLETGISDLEEDDFIDDKYASLIVREAQLPLGAKPLEVSEDDIPVAKPKDVGDVIEAALKNVTINDVIERLDILSNIYKRREIARQLSLIDILLDKLGLGSYFPSLGEAMGKSLESNQYISTRIEDVLSRLRGAVVHPESNKIVSDTPAPPAETEALRQTLEQQQAMEDARKERRKQKDEAKALQGEMPKPEAELAGPAKVEQAPSPPLPR